MLANLSSEKKTASTFLPSKVLPANPAIAFAESCLVKYSRNIFVAPGPVLGITKLLRAPNCEHSSLVSYIISWYSWSDSKSFIVSMFLSSTTLLVKPMSPAGAGAAAALAPALGSTNSPDIYFARISSQLP